MTDPQQEPRPDEHRALTWLQRVVLRLGGERRGDVVAAQIGPGARNIVVGKNNIQINVGERNLAVPIVAIALALIAIAGILVYPYAKPRLFPEKMTGKTNIAIAEIGEIGAFGGVKTHRLGKTLRDAIYRDLDNELKQYFPDWMANGDIQLRHDLGPIPGRTPEQRRQNAERLTGTGRTSIHATVVVYGYITNQDGEWTLKLEFYYKSPTVRQDPDAVSGRYVLADAITLPGDPAEDPEMAWDADELLGPRMSALALITMGLIYDIRDDHESAKEIFQSALTGFQDALAAAEGRLSAVERKDWDTVEAILHFFVGRQALFLRDYDLAIQELNQALALYADFANAQHTLGAVYFDMAQLYFSFRDGEEIPPEQRICFDPDQVARTKARFADEAAAWQTLETSEETLLSAVEMAQKLQWSHVEHVARLTLGLAYQLEAGALLARDGSTTLIDQKLGEAETQFEDALDGFTEDRHPQYIGWSHLGLGLVQDNRADLIYRQNEEVVAAHNEQTVAVLQSMDARVTDAIRHYDDCLKQKANVVLDKYFTDKVITCGCEYYGHKADEYQQQLRAYMSELRDQVAGN